MVKWERLFIAVLYWTVFHAIQGAADERKPIQSTADKGRAIQGTTDEGRAIQGTTDESRPIQGTTDEGRPIQGSADERRPIQGTTDEDKPIQGATDEGRSKYRETLLQRERTAQAHFLAIAEFSLFPNDEFTKGNKGKNLGTGAVDVFIINR